MIVLVEFAIALMTILDQINRDSFQRFKLRMGEYQKPFCSNEIKKKSGKIGIDATLKTYIEGVSILLILIYNKIGDI